jgi:8-oxo-dGTP pyrophosphatase MutT (NUDIX family)
MSVKIRQMERQFTATAYVVEGGKVLLIRHPKLGKWLPPGGHLEANETPPEGARREVFEETGLEIRIIPQENIWIDRWNASSVERPYLCLIENIPPHGESAEHQHIDMIYLAHPVGGTLAEGARWFSLEEVLALKDDDEIFVETKTTIQHILEQRG